MKYMYRNESAKFDYFEEFDLEYGQNFYRNQDVKKLIGYIGSKSNVLNIFIVDPLDDHLLFAYGVKEFSEFLYIDTKNFKDEIVRKIHMSDSFLVEFLNHFAKYETNHCFIHAPYFIKDKNGIMNEIDTCFEKSIDNCFEQSNYYFSLNIDYRVGQKISFDNGNIQCKTIGNGSFNKSAIHISKEQFNIVYNGLVAFRSNIMNNINKKNHWGSKMKDRSKCSLGFKMKGLDSEYNVNVRFSSSNQIIKITDKNNKMVYNGKTIVINNKKYKIDRNKGNLKLPNLGYDLITQFPETMLVDNERIEITFQSFYIEKEKLIIISLDMHENNPLESILNFEKPMRVAKDFIIDNLDVIYSIFNRHDEN